jgi:predicted nucleotidyltransferase
MAKKKSNQKNKKIRYADHKMEGELVTDFLPPPEKMKFNIKITEGLIKEISKRLREAAPGAKIILFGSRARGDAGEASDLDILVVENKINAQRKEMMRLNDALRPLGVPVDILVASKKNFKEWSEIPGTIFYKAAKEGRAL